MKTTAFSNAAILLFISGVVAVDIGSCKCVLPGSSKPDHQANRWCCVENDYAKLDGDLCWFFGAKRKETAAAFMDCCVYPLHRQWSCFG